MRKDRLKIIYEDKFLIAIDKPAHLLTIGTKDEKTNTLYYKTSEYEKKKNKKNKIFIVNRLDKDTSGIVLFAKDQLLKDALQKDWNNLAIKREYIAIVEGSVKKNGEVREYLKETPTLLSIKTTKNQGKLAITEYEVLKSSKQYSILKIAIKTGRKNQIRAAMSHINHPIIGDKKYGSTKNPLRRMCLHASKLIIINPMTKKEMEFTSSIPSEFKIFKM